MADYLSGMLSFSGLSSGIDTARLIELSKKKEVANLNRLKAAKEDWNKRYEAFGEVISAVRDGKSKLSAVNSADKFVIKKCSSTDEAAVSATAGAKAANGVCAIDVKQLAANSIWATDNTYAAKTSSVNTTSTDQNFTYTYKGKTRTLTIPPGVHLESFVSMVNQDRENPGVKMSLVKTITGYALQVRGNDTGKDATLAIHPNNLSGMSMAGGSAEWASALLSAPSTQPVRDRYAINTYKYTIDLVGGQQFNVVVDGDETPEALRNAINTAANANIARVEDNRLVIDGVVKVKTEATNLPAPGNAVTTNSVSRLDSLVQGKKLTDRLDSANPNGDILVSLRRPTPPGGQENFAMKGSNTWQDFVNAVRDKGFKVRASESGGDINMSMWGLADIVTNPSGIISSQPAVQEWSTETGGGSVQKDVPPKTLDYVVTKADGTTETVSIANTQSMDDLIAALNTRLGAGRATLETDATTGKNYIKVTGVFGVSGWGISGQVTSAHNWTIQRAQDAVFKVDNFAQEITSASNTVTDVLEGVTLTLKDTKKVQLSISTDVEAIKKNVQVVLDAVNGVFAKIMELTKFYKKKQLASNKPEDANYSTSLYDFQLGSVLTGNYGVQLFNTRFKSLMTSVPPGFKIMDSANPLSGDVVAAFSQIGIKNCSQESNANHGLFMIAPPGFSEAIQGMDRENFDAAVGRNLEALISFFSADDEGSSSSANFRYQGHLSGMTKAGAYKVSYTVNPGGDVANVMINGVPANRSDRDPLAWSAGNDAGGAAGLSIKVDNLSPGSYTGDVVIKQGKLRQLDRFFDEELVFHAPNAKEPLIGAKNGALMILQDNYRGIMNEIDKKIESEQTRIARWEKKERKRYSDLEKVFAKYRGIEAKLNSELKRAGA